MHPSQDHLSTLSLIGLHLGPGALGAVAFVLLYAPFDAAGIPPLAALLAAIVFVILPLELGTLVLLRRRAKRAGDSGDLIPYKEELPVRVWVWMVPAMLAAALVGSGLFSFLDTVIAKAGFSWLPGWYLRPFDPERVNAYSMNAWIATLVGYAIVNGIAGPIVEELYFRGYLLPRMERYGRWAPLINVILFSLYHFWSPWQFLSRIAAVALFVYGVWWKRNVYLGMVIHSLLNLTSVAIVTAAVLNNR